jgi:hypothetical protein
MPFSSVLIGPTSYCSKVTPLAVSSSTAAAMSLTSKPTGVAVERASLPISRKSPYLS